MSNNEYANNDCHYVYGPQGTIGPQGPVGKSGARGMQGLHGQQGAKGPRGYKGDRGPQGTIGPAGPYVLSVSLDNISNPSSCFIVAPKSGIITKIYSIIDGTISENNATITANVNGNNIPETIIINAASIAGTINSCSPNSNNSIASGQFIKLTTDGRSTGDIKSTFTIEISHSD